MKNTKPPPPKPPLTITAGNENGRQEMRSLEGRQDQESARHNTDSRISRQLPSIY